MYWNGGGWAWMAFMPVLWIVLIGLVVWAVVRLTHQRSGDGGAHEEATVRRETAEEILDRRFASGEMDAAAYDEARRRLAAHRPGNR
ncbi:SHOCT domain-containing protein [Streptomyces sp. NPDC048411]|uniref:SHOCT domain-containing protein n=1 Tax=Streptomyces sp. NPDC048411 TaxID=3157206 RepID=UPI003454716C